MNIIVRIKGWFEENKEDLMLLLLVGLPTGILCIIFAYCIASPYIF